MDGLKQHNPHRAAGLLVAALLLACGCRYDPPPGHGADSGNDAGSSDTEPADSGIDRVDGGDDRVDGGSDRGDGGSDRGDGGSDRGDGGSDRGDGGSDRGDGGSDRMDGGSDRVDGGSDRVDGGDDRMDGGGSLWSFAPPPEGLYETRVPARASYGAGLPVYRSVGGDPRTEGALQSEPLWLGQRKSWFINWASEKDSAWSDVWSTTYHVRPELPQLAGGCGHTLVVTPDGTLWGWGGGSNGKLGQGPDTGAHMEPVKVADGVRAVWANGDDSMYLDQQGRLWVMGSGPWPGVGSKVGTPARVPLPDGVVVHAAAVSGGGVLAVDSDDQLWVWGSNYSHTLGIGEPDAATPRVVLNNVTLVAADSFHSLAVKVDGSVWVTGVNDYLQGCNRLGGNLEKALEWTRLVGTTADTWPDIFSLGAGPDLNWFLTAHGDLWMWGCNNENIPGVAKATLSVDSPTKVLSQVAAVAVGLVTVVVPEQGPPVCYGFPGHLSCLRLPSALAASGLRSLHSGYDHSLALTAGFLAELADPWKAVYGWGANYEGQLGPSQR